MPVVQTHSVVCRDDLLFEIEVEASVAAKVGDLKSGGLGGRRFVAADVRSRR